jgi:hypothetical protein
MKNQYCPNVDRFIACILLDLIELTRIHVGIDFNSLKWCSHSHRGFSPVLDWPVTAENRLNGFLLTA